MSFLVALQALKYANKWVFRMKNAYFSFFFPYFFLIATQTLSNQIFRTVVVAINLIWSNNFEKKYFKTATILNIIFFAFTL